MQRLRIARFGSARQLGIWRAAADFAADAQRCGAPPDAAADLRTRGAVPVSALWGVLGGVLGDAARIGGPLLR